MLPNNLKLEFNKEEMTEALAALVKIRSVQEPSCDNMPFGAGVKKALDEFLALGESMGFRTVNYDNYAGYVEWGDEGEIIAIPGHMDVVPEGDGWSFEPYGAEIADGKMYGRGTSDNKGPMLAALFAMKALKDAGYEPKNRIRLIAGCDEESVEWESIKYYNSRAEKAARGFTPDGDFPLARAEKGIILFDIAKKLDKPAPNAAGLSLSSFKGGTAYNVVPSEAVMTVMGNNYAEIKEMAAAYTQMTGREIHCRARGKSLEITARGKAAHGAHPELGLNAVSILADFAHTLKFNSESVMDVFDFYCKHIGFCTDGSDLGVDYYDEDMGGVAFNAGIMEMTREDMKLTVHARLPRGAEEEEFYEKIMPALNSFDMGVVKRDYKKPVWFSEDDPFIQKLWGVYKEMTGDSETRPIISPCSSYAKCFDYCVPFGMVFPGEPDVMHQKDEFIPLERYYQTAEIYAAAIIALDY